MGFQLFILEGKNRGRQLSFEQSGIVLGRGPGCHVLLEDPGVSRQHARICLEDGAYLLEDAGSATGTKLNGVNVRKSKLRDGDAIGVGMAVLRFSADASEPTQVRPPVPNSAQSATRLIPVDQSSLARPSRAWSALLRTVPTRSRLALCFAPILLIALGVAAQRHRRKATTAAEAINTGPITLSRTPIEASFGFGNGVTYSRSRLVLFEFELTSPAQAVVLLHFQGRDIAPGEMAIEVNNQRLMVPPPGANQLTESSYQLLIPARVLRRGEKNTVAFIPTPNPPEYRPWRIRHLWIETLPLPALLPDQLLLQAELAFQRAQQNFSRREVGAPNRYLAWKDYRTGWLMLEAHPEPRPDLYWLMRDRVREAQAELDRLCSKLRLEIHRYASQKEWSAVRATLDQVTAYFPSDDQPCAKRVEQTLTELPW
jgi:hypothetical protein